jgi:ATP-dependent Clp protease ATP-binding subunit ClpX
MPTKDGGTVEIEIDTKDILFVFGGAFVGLENKEPTGRTIGFGEHTNDSVVPAGVIEQKDIIKFGFIPEFIGRIPIIVQMHELTREDLKTILIGTDKSILKQYQAIFNMDKIKASFDETLVTEIIDNSIAKKMGARGLRGTIEKDMMNLMFEVSKYNQITTLNITRKMLNNPSEELKNI